MVILGRMVRWTPGGIECEADKRHRDLVLEAFGLDDESKSLVRNTDKGCRVQDWESEKMQWEEAIEFRGIPARMNFLSQDSLDLQYPVKECSKEMAEPTQGSWKRANNSARYLVYCKAVV